MNKAIVGTKLGMSQVFNKDGTLVPVTVIQAGPCPVIQVKTADKDGYEAVKVAFSDIKENRVNKCLKGEFKKAKVPAKRYLREFKLENASGYQIGQEIKCDIFSEGDVVDVTGTTRGRGYTGTIQRWNFHRGPMGHGSGYHRGVGSLGSNSTPSKVLKNKKMPGQYGNERVTIQNLKVVKIDSARNLIMVKGAVPGPKKGLVIIKQAVKG
ncbi:MAG: 50S ribosomal protein L3 [Christensenellales bacterium]|jgi:large subunit ribosomal protein L3